MERAFGRPLAGFDAADDPAAAASACAQLVSAVDGESTLRNDAERDVVRCLGGSVVAADTLAAQLPRIWRQETWQDWRKGLNVQLPSLRRSPVAIAVTVVVLAVVAMVLFRQLGHLSWFKLPAAVVGMVALVSMRCTSVPPWPLLTVSHLVSHVVIERAAALGSQHRWTLAEVADVVAASSDLAPGNPTLMDRWETWSPSD